MPRGLKVSVRDRLIIWDFVAKGIRSPTRIKEAFDDMGEREISDDTVRKEIADYEAFLRLLPEYSKLRQELGKVCVGGHVVEKFLEEHLQEVRELLEKWKYSMRTASHLKTRLSFDNAQEKERIFQGILQHCPSVREIYEIFKRERECYESKKVALATRIAKESELETGERFAMTVVHCAILVSKGSSYPNYILDSSTGWLRIEDGDDRKGIARGDTAFLEECQRHHKDLIQTHSQSKEMEEINSTMDILVGVERSLNETIEASMLRKEYANWRCDLCPGSES